jgi:hypothetical protein
VAQALRTTSFPRALVALFVGSLAAAILVTALELTLRLTGAIHVTVWCRYSGAACLALQELPIAVFSFAWFLAGLLVIAAPCWWALDRLGRRSWLDALTLGFLLTFLAVAAEELARGYALVHRALTAEGWLRAAQYGVALGAVGGVVGMVIWLVAYRSDEKEAGALGNVR